MTEEQIKQGKAEIDQLSHIELCRHWRFSTGRKEWFDSRTVLGEYFQDRLFKHFGGFTAEISKEIGW